MPGNDKYTYLLLHGGSGGDDGVTTLVDSSSMGSHTMTSNSGAQIDTAIFKFNSASLLCTASSWLTAPNSTDWNFTAGANTVDFWIYFADTSLNSGLWGTYLSSASGYMMYYYGPNGNLYLYEGGDKWSYAWNPAQAQWYHMAFAINSTTTTVFINGNSVGTTTAVTWNDDGQLFSVGRGNSKIEGNIDEFRVSKGIARWTANFTPPTKEYDSLAEYVSSLSDNLISTDSLGKSAGRTRLFSDDITEADYYTRRVGYNRDFSDSSTMNSIQPIKGEVLFPFLDTITLKDIIEAIGGTSRTFRDSIATKDFLDRVLILSREFGDTATMGDLIRKSVSKTLIDSMTVTDILSAELIISRTFSETITLNEIFDTVKGLLREYSDSMAMSDHIIVGQAKILLDRIAMLDSFSRIIQVSKSPKDTIRLGENDMSVTSSDVDVIEISQNPQIAAGARHGQTLSIRYVINDPKLRFIDGRGLAMWQNKAFTMSSGSVINFIYDTGNTVWQETSRSDSIYTLTGEA